MPIRQVAFHRGPEHVGGASLLLCRTLYGIDIAAAAGGPATTGYGSDTGFEHTAWKVDSGGVLSRPFAQVVPCCLGDLQQIGYSFVLTYMPEYSSMSAACGRSFSMRLFFLHLHLHLHLLLFLPPTSAGQCSTRGPLDEVGGCRQ